MLNNSINNTRQLIVDMNQILKVYLICFQNRNQLIKKKPIIVLKHLYNYFQSKI